MDENDGRVGSAEPVLGPDGQPYRVAVLVPTINNADELDGVLARLMRQTYPSYEVIVSDSKSKDHTKDCLLYTSPSPRDRTRSRMPSSA